MSQVFLKSDAGRPWARELKNRRNPTKIGVMNIRAMDQISDDDIVVAIAQGDSSSESELVRRYQRPLMAYCCARSDASRGLDLAQQVWLKILPKLREGKYNGQHVMALLCQTARNLAVDLHRRRGENTPSLDSQPMETSCHRRSSPLSHLVAAEEMRALSDCKKRLLDKEVAVLDGDDEAPELEAVSKPRIYKLRHFAIRKLRDCVRKKLDRGAS